MMEETTANSPSSAAAALSAPDMPGQKVNTTGLKLLIKSSNQQHDDQIIESDLMWTVRHLKAHLSNVYPSKPPIGEQKLIYSGQLLNDRSQLKDIIRSYKDVYTQHHILHLVHTPKNAPPPNLSQKPKTPSKMTNNSNAVPQSSSTTSTSGINANSSFSSSSSDGLRQRHSAGGPVPATDAPQMPMPGFWPYAAFMQGQPNPAPVGCPYSGGNTASPFMGGDYQTMAAQQAAINHWMWQAYQSYMQQINAQASAASNATTSPASPFFTPINPVIAFPSAQHLYAQYPASASAAAAAAATATATPTPLATSAPDAVAAPAADAAPAQAQAQQQPLAEAQPRFPNIVQDEQENRDWLDNFFAVMRLALFLTILYVNSSPIRCLIVFVIAGGIYLYHIGVLRLRQERNNNDINRNNNAAAAEQIRQGVQQVQQAQEAQQRQQQEAGAGPEGDAADNGAAANGEPTAALLDVTPVSSAAGQQEDAVDNNQTSVIAFMRSFVVSFFTSLLPEAPAAL